MIPLSSFPGMCIAVMRHDSGGANLTVLGDTTVAESQASAGHSTHQGAIQPPHQGHAAIAEQRIIRGEREPHHCASKLWWWCVINARKHHVTDWKLYSIAPEQ